MRMFVICCALLAVFYDRRTNGQEMCTNGQTNYTKQEYTEVDKEVNVTTRVWTTIPAQDCNLLEELVDVIRFWRQAKCDSIKIQRVQTKTVTRSTVESYDVNRCCPGYTNVSDVCIQGCPAGTYGQDNCTQNCTFCRSYCNKTSGACICDDGFTGENCTEACAPGFYGSHCLYNCTCSNHGTCNGTDGSCNCTLPGWRGSHCNEECIDGTYGLYCMDNCTCNINQTCNTVNGSCTCKPGWKGENCSQECESTNFGVDCTDTCTCNSTYTEYCDKAAGYCICMPGYMGQNCIHECPPGLYGRNCSENCSVQCTDRNTGYCHHINGTCICLGKRGDNCTEDCHVGTYGPDCEWPCNCNNQTSRSETCDNISGNCSCVEGWTGQRCDQDLDTTGSSLGTTARLGFIEKNMVYIGPAGVVLFIIAIAVIFTVCSCRKSTHTREKIHGDSLVVNSQDNQSYESGENRNINLEHLSIKAQINQYEETYIEDENQINESKEDSVRNSGTIETSGDTDDKDARACTECSEQSTNQPYADDDHYSSPDFDNDRNTNVLKSKEFKPETEHTGIETADGCTGKATGKKKTEYEDTTDDKAIYETAPDEYNTFEDVRKLQKAASQKEHDIEEDYDVISHNKSQKMGEEEGYSSFEQVRKLSLQVQNNEADDNIVIDETASNEYNTFEDVRKLQKAASQKEHDTEEDYDVISHTKYRGDIRKDEYYSFEQVRKLSLQVQNNDDDVYNVLSKNLPLHQSAALNVDTYHHINLENKTIDVENTDLSETKTQRQISYDKELLRQNRSANTTTTSVKETEEDIHENINSDSPVFKNDSNDVSSATPEEKYSFYEIEDDGIQKDNIDDIYDECNPMDDNLDSDIAQSEHKSIADIASKLQAIRSVATDEVVYEECDMAVVEKPRPTSPVDYEYVSNEEDYDKINKDVEKTVSGENEESVKMKMKPSVKRSTQRRREDYEVFEL